MMTYEQSLDFLYNSLPMFQRIGGAAYKPGLGTSMALDNLFGNPHKTFKSIHIAGTNGKGSTSHLIASILQLSGYKVGLYTSPHLVDFRERIRVNGKMISKEAVTDFVNRYLDMNFDGSPSFFELTMMMAFDYFRSCNVDYAIIEVGLGGRLDSTNIITPILSVITNISFDHTQFLGNTLPQIASEKAGIIKPGIPVVIGEDCPEIHDVFIKKAKTEGAPITFAEEQPAITCVKRENDLLQIDTHDYGTIIGELSGECQTKNANTVLTAINWLKQLGVKITNEAVINGFKNVCEISGLMGRWMIVGHNPRVVCDTGHNVGGIKYIVNQLKKENYNTLHIIIGFVNDKDISHILDLMPRNAVYYFTQASVSRALNCESLAKIAHEKGLAGNCYPTVKEAYKVAMENCSGQDMIYIGGSTFVVADFLPLVSNQ